MRVRALHGRSLLVFLLNMEVEKVICVEGQLTDIEVSQLDTGLKVENVKQHHFDYLLSRFEKSAQINLLQGEFKVVASSSEPTKAVAGIAGMLCIWFVVAIVCFAVEGYWGRESGRYAGGANIIFICRIFS